MKVDRICNCDSLVIDVYLVICGIIVISKIEFFIFLVLNGLAGFVQLKKALKFMLLVWKNDFWLEAILQ